MIDDKKEIIKDALENLRDFCPDAVVVESLIGFVGMEMKAYEIYTSEGGTQLGRVWSLDKLEAYCNGIAAGLHHARDMVWKMYDKMSEIK